MFQKITGMEKIMDKRGVRYHVFPSENFCHTVLKKFVKEPFKVSQISGIEKCW